jgi:hypothetical protein
MPSSHVVLDQVDITFDDQGSAASAGLLLPATLAERLGIEQVTDQVVDLGDRLGAAHPGRKLLTLVHARGDLPALGAARLYVGVVPRDRKPRRVPLATEDVTGIGAHSPCCGRGVQLG